MRGQKGEFNVDRNVEMMVRETMISGIFSLD